MIKGRQITVHEVSKLKKSNSITTGLLTIVPIGNGEYEIEDPWGDILWQGDAASTTAYANGFNQHGYEDVVQTDKAIFTSR